jgi:putative intracellular protease/amidase
MASLSREAGASLLRFQGRRRHTIVLASPKGGQPPLDPKSAEPNFQTGLTHRFEADAAARAQLASTLRLDSIRSSDFDAVFYPGGHGPMWDLAEDRSSVKLIESFLATSKPVALVCHAPGALRHVETPDRKPLVEGRKVTGEHRGRSGGPDQGRAVPRGGPAEGEGRHFLQDGGLGRPRR